MQLTAYTEGINILSGTSDDSEQALHLLFSNRAQCHILRERYQEAIRDATSAILLEKTFGKSYLRRATALMKTG